MNTSLSKRFSSTLAHMFSVVSALYMLAVPHGAYAMVEPVSVATDPRIKTITYGPDMVYKYTGYIRYQTSIEFGANENIQTIAMGDTTAWKMNQMGNKLFLKPVDLDATTNMMLTTTKRTYLFELHAEEAKDISDPNITFVLRFVYPDDTDGGVVTTLAGMDGVPDLESEDLSKFNFRYSITGSDEISPVRIFDDGEFTFFEFRGINADIPAIFKVDNEGNEALINFRSRGRYIVVERVSGRYTLRLGNKVVCVFNEAWGATAPKPGSNDGMFSSSSVTYRQGSTVK